MKKIYLVLISILMLGTIQNAFSQITGDTSICTGDAATYYAGAIPGGGYTWTVVGGNIVGPANADSVVISWGIPGTGSLFVTVTIPNSPPQSYFVNLFIHPKPSPKITHAPYPTCPTVGGEQGAGTSPDQHGKDNCENVCKYATVTYTTTSNPGSTYFWVVNGEVIFIGQNTNAVTVTWDSTAFGSVTVYETNQWGCSDSSTLCIKKVDLPVANFTHQMSVCKGSTVNFNNLSTGAVSYQWYFGDGGSSTLFNPSHAYLNGGTYTITLIVTNKCYCKDTLQSVIVVDSLPGPDISCPSTVCANDTATYSTSQPGCTYNWFVNGGTIVGPANQQSVTVAWGPGQMGMLGLYVSGCAALCSDTTWIYIPIIPTTGQIAGPQKVCPGDCFTYSLPRFSGTIYNWSLNSGACGTITDTCHCETIEICFPSYIPFCNDTLTVNFYNPILGCGGTAKKIIRVRPRLDIFGSQLACANGTSNFFTTAGLNANWTISPAGPILSPSPAPVLTVDWNNLTGSFVITAKPVNLNQVCQDSVSISVNVVPPPAKPVISGDTLVCANSTIQYCATGTGNIQWLITGGTPVNASGNCVTVNWGNTPPYIVKSFVQMPGSPYCSSDTAIQNITIFNSLPQPVINGSNNACANSTNNYSTSTPFPAGAVYNWTISPANAGTILNGPGSNPIQVEWGNNAPQTVVITLNVSICGLSSSDTIQVHLQNPPTPVITQIGNLCPGVNAQLSVSGGAFVAYNWTGPSFSAVTNPVTISLKGLYQVTVTDAAGCTALTQITTFYVGAPVASISSPNILYHCVGDVYADNLCALGNGSYNYLWSNGATTQCNAVSTPGTYLVTVTDPSTGCYSVSNFLNVVESPCIPDTLPPCIPAGSISFVPSSCNPKVFTNTSVNGGSFSWNFGDLNFSNAVSPTHYYNQAAFYIVTLSGLVPNAAGTDSCLLVDTAVIEIPLLARYNFTTGCFGDPVCFTDNSATTAGNSITGWYWNFGDGNNSTLQNPCHTYSLAGQYFVTMTITNGSCTTSIVDTVVVPPKVNAAFTFGIAGCINSPIPFTDNSTTNINYWNWDFGNGGTSLNQNPSMSYNTSGTFPVTLIVHDINGCYDTVTQIVTINAPLVSGNITAYPDTIVCAGTPVLLVAPACGTCSYLWGNGSVNDSITVTSTGIYTVAITDANGCVYVTSIKIIVNQGPYAIISGPTHKLCLGSYTNLSVPYNLTWSYEWLSNDLVVNGSTNAGVFIMPGVAGTFNYQVVITDTITGCSDTTAAFILNVYAPPVPPSISAIGPISVCAGDTITLVVTHPDPSVSFKWNTGEVNDTILVTKDGCYTVVVTDTNGCTSQSIFCVTVNALPEICAFFEGCMDTCAPFLIPGPPFAASYQWMLNGVPIAGATSQNYLATVSGVYSLVATSAFGCVDTTGNLNLTLYPCGDSSCVDLVIDSVYCDPTTGTYVMDYHVINLSTMTISEVNLQILPPNLNVATAPNLSYLNLLPGDTSGTLSTIIYNGVAGSTYCFRTHVAANNFEGEEIWCCESDTACVTLPECGPDTSCCYLNILSDSVWCVQNEMGIPQYNFNLVVTGCGELNIISNNNGPISLMNPYILTGTPVTISGSYYSNQDPAICLTFLLMSLNNCGFCVDSTICFDLPPCPPTSTPCDSLIAGFTEVVTGTIASFTDQSIVGGGMVIIGYSWNFGDPASGPNNVSALANPIHVFSGPGTYNVCLVVIGMIPTTGEICTDIICKLVHIDEIPTDPCELLNAGFAYTFSSLTGTFTDVSTTGPGMFIASWSWDFGDPASGGNNFSNLQNPTHVFSGPGFYNICLYIMAKTVTGEVCYDTICKELWVEEIISSPCDSLFAAFTYASNGLTLNFSNVSTLGVGMFISSLSWNFGDPGSGVNNTSNLPNPVHVFTASGWYDICLVVDAYVPSANLKCSDTICMHIYVEGNPPYDPCDSVSADFSYITNGLFANFTETSTLPLWVTITNWSWDFGDPASGANNYSGLQNPSHTFVTPGFHMVCLIITTTNPIDIICYDTICKEIFVEGPSGSPCDNLIGSYAFNSNGLTVNFTNTSTVGGGLVFSNISWNFGDPASGLFNVSNLPNPTHVFTAPGSYDVCMIVEAYLPGSNLKCSDTICQHIFVESFPPNDPCDSVSADFSYITNGLFANFTETSTLPLWVTITNWSWNFGDPASGANNFSGLQNPTHTFVTPGFHTVCLIITTTNPIDIICYDTICKDIFVEGPTLNPCDSLIPSFTFVTNNGTVYFTNTTVAGAGLTNISYSWNFGNPASGINNVSYIQNPSHSFTSSGLYQVCLTVVAITPDGQDCIKTFCMTIQLALISTGGGVSGDVTYDNLIHTALNSVWIDLVQGSTVVTSTTTDVHGHYIFTDIVPGTYKMRSSFNGIWGGVNATDALLILKHFVGSVQLTGVRKTAADVDASGYINSGDALQAMKRFVNIQSSFTSGDWAFEQHVLDIDSGGNIIDNFKSVCYGDVNGSYLPPTAKPEPSVFIENMGIQVLEPGKPVVVPVMTKDPMDCGAVSLVMEYPEHILNIEEVLAVRENQNLVYHASNGTLRLAWYSLAPVKLAASDILFNLKISLKETASTSQIPSFTISGESRIADGNAVEYESRTLLIPQLVADLRGMQLEQNRPNPFNDITEISFSVPTDGQVELELTDISGRVVMQIQRGMYGAGHHSVTFSRKGIESGVYFYRMTFENGSQKMSQTRKMVISR